MYRIQYLLFIFFLLNTQLVIAGKKDILPVLIDQYLDKQYPNWEFPTIFQLIDKQFEQSEVKHPPYLLWGDFDSNGQMDYALQITYDSSDTTWIAFFTFLNTQEYFEAKLLRKVEITNPHKLSGFYLVLHKKDSSGPKSTMPDFHFPHDAIGVYYYATAGVAYYWTGEKFQQIQMAD